MVVGLCLVAVTEALAGRLFSREALEEAVVVLVDSEEEAVVEASVGLVAAGAVAAAPVAAGKLVEYVDWLIELIMLNNY